MNLVRLWPLAACTAVASAAAAVGGCSTILGVPSGTLSFCARPENEAHDYCEDYDVGDPSARWSQAIDAGGATWALASSDDSPPNLIDFHAMGNGPDGGQVVAGYYKTFTNKPLVGLKVEADVRFKGDPSRFGGGFMLVGASPGACIGLGVAPWMVADAGYQPGTLVFGGVYVPQGSGGCQNLVGLGGENAQSLATAAFGDAGFDAGMQLPPEVPGLNEWFHLVIQIVPDTNGDGGGILQLRAGGLSYGNLRLPPGTIQKDALGNPGQPVVGFAAAPSGSPFPEEVQFDNVTVDVSRQQIQ